MRRYIYVLLVAVTALSCEKSGLEIKSGNVLGEIEVAATAGRLTVSVETVGRWIVYEADDAPWVSFDVQGGVGNGAFTVSYQDNMSSVIDAKSSRKARIVVTSEDYAKSDTLNIIQVGFYSDIRPSQVKPSPEIVLEYVTPETKTMTVVYCSAEGVTDQDTLAFAQWAGQFDVVACGNGFIMPRDVPSGEKYTVWTVGDVKFVRDVPSGKKYTLWTVGDVNFVSADLKEAFDDGEEYEAFLDIIENTYNAQNSPSKWVTKWVIGGQLYHYSMMQTAYPGTPSWYPEDLDALDFASDRYAWNNNLYDCLWIAEHDFVPTWTSDEDKPKSYMADYVYVSRDVLATICEVRKLDKVHGMTHNPIQITIKY